MLAFVAAIRTIHGTLSHAGDDRQALTRLYIACQMGHDNAQRVDEIYATWADGVRHLLPVMLNTGLAQQQRVVSLVPHLRFE